MLMSIYLNRCFNMKSFTSVSFARSIGMDFRKICGIMMLHLHTPQSSLKLLQHNPLIVYFLHNMTVGEKSRTSNVAKHNNYYLSAFPSKFSFCRSSANLPRNTVAAPLRRTCETGNRSINRIAESQVNANQLHRGCESTCSDFRIITEAL